MRLRQPEIAALWIANGGNPAKADEASAVAMAESNGDTEIDNGVCCVGLYQFHREYFDEKCAKNPVCATRLAIKTSKNGTDWSAWEAHTNGSYRKYLGRSRRGSNPKNTQRILAGLKLPGLPEIDVPNPLGPFHPLNPLEPDTYGKIGDAVGSIPGLEGVKNISAFFTGLGELILTPEGWLRTGKLIGGALLVAWGLRIIATQATGTDPIKAATDTAKKGAEAAAVVATVK